MTFEVGWTALEQALVRAYRVPKKDLGAFRGKLGHLSKLGLAGVSPGKGHALAYSGALLHRWVMACELLEFGIGRAAVVSLIDELWERRLRGIFQHAEREVMRDPVSPDHDVVLYMGGVSMMLAAVDWAKVIPNVNSCPASKLGDHMREWMKFGPDDPSGLPPRVLLVNLTARLRTFHRELARAHMDELRAQPGATKQAKRTRKKRT